MIDAPEETAAKSISELSTEHGIHISSITRLAQKLGFHGFHELKGVFRSNLKNKSNYYTEQVKHLLQQDHEKTIDGTSVLGQLVQDEWSNVLRMVDEVEKEKLQTVVDLIKNATHVAVLGLRGSYPAAYYLSFYLRMILNNVSLLGKPGNTIGEDISRLDRGGLLIAISVTPYTLQTIAASRLCKSHQIELVTITDNLASPLATMTNNVLLTPMQGKYFFSPIVAMMLCIECLLAEIVIQLGDDALSRLNRLETVLGALEIEA